MAQAPQSQRHGAFAQESRARLSLRRRYPRRYRRVRRSSGLLGAAGAGLQLLLGPGTSGFDVTFLFLVHDAEASWPRSTQGAPSARPSPPLRAPATPPTQRTDPAPSRHLAPPTRRLAHLASTSPAFALVCAQEVNLALLPRPGSRSARRGGATAAARPVRAGRPLGCPGGARSGDGGGVGARRRHLQGGQRWAQKGHRTLVVFFPQAFAWHPPSNVGLQPGRGLGVPHWSSRLLLSACNGSQWFRASAFVDVRYESK